MQLDWFPLISIIPLIRVTKSDLAISYSFPNYPTLGAVWGPLWNLEVWVIKGPGGHLQWWYLYNYCSYSCIYLMISHVVLLTNTLVSQPIIIMYSDPWYYVPALSLWMWANRGWVQWCRVSFNVWNDTLPSFWASCIDAENHLVVEKSWEDKYHY